MNGDLVASGSTHMLLILEMRHRKSSEMRMTSPRPWACRFTEWGKKATVLGTKNNILAVSQHYEDYTGLCQVWCLKLDRVLIYFSSCWCFS